MRGPWRTCFTALTLVSFLGGAAAQDYPNRTIRIIVPYGAGMVSDTMARIIADRLAPVVRQPIVIENRPGAGGMLGNDMVAKAAPDGYTLLSQTMASLGPAAVDKMPYDPVQDFAGISPIANVAGILVATKSRGFKTLKDLVAYAKANPGVLSYASLGPGSPSYIYSEKLKLLAGFDAVGVPYKGPSDAMTDLIAGRVDFFTLSVATAMPFIREGQLDALAVTSSKRPPFLSDVPTTVEAGFPNSALDSGVGLWAPKQTPRSIIEMLNRDVLEITQSPEVRQKLLAFGAEPWPTAPEEFDAHMKRDIEEMQALMARTRAKHE